MSKKPAKKAWSVGGLDEFRQDGPFMAFCEAHQKHRIVVQPASIELGKNDRGWRCLFVEMDHPDSESFERTEIPFWAIDAFLKALATADEDDDEIEMTYNRMFGEDGKNNAFFRCS